MADTQDLTKDICSAHDPAALCVQLDAALGNEDARQLLEALGSEPLGLRVSGNLTAQDVANPANGTLLAHAILAWTRFEAVNRLIEERPKRQIVDLPCGYTTRGASACKRGRTYFGLDAPSVVGAMGPAAQRVIAGKGNKPRIGLLSSRPAGHAYYRACETTKYSSLRIALKEVAGRLLLATDGLLARLTQRELEELFASVRKLLLAHGGSWILAERDFALCGHDVALAVLGGDAELAALCEAQAAQAEEALDVKTGSNVWFDPNEQRVQEFVERMGFGMQKIPLRDLLPQNFGALGLKPEVEAAVREAFEELFVWELWVAKSGGPYVYHSKRFYACGKVEDSVLRLELRGHLDSYTSPELLAVFQRTKPQTLRGIEVDLRDLDYISSAGIRVLLVMYRSVEGEEHFVIKNPNASVRVVLEATGLTDLYHA